VAFADNPASYVDPRGTQATASDVENPFARYAAAEKALHNAYVSRAPQDEIDRLTKEYTKAYAALNDEVDYPFLEFFGKQVRDAVIGELTGLALIRVLGWGVRLAANTGFGRFIGRVVVEHIDEAVTFGRQYLDRVTRVGRELSELEGQSLESLVQQSAQRLASKLAGEAQMSSALDRLRKLAEEVESLNEREGEILEVLGDLIEEEGLRRVKGGIPGELIEPRVLRRGETVLVKDRVRAAARRLADAGHEKARALVRQLDDIVKERRAIRRTRQGINRGLGGLE
jgi:hypothetical protein